MENTVSVGIEYPYATITQINESGEMENSQTILIYEDLEKLKQPLEKTKGRIIFDNNNVKLNFFIRNNFGVQRMYMNNTGHKKASIAFSEGVKISQKIKDECPYNFEAVESFKEAGLLANYAIMKSKNII